MRIAVVGAGLGGLAAAIAVTRAGHDVTVYERASALRESGAGIGLMPNGVLALDALGVGVRDQAVATGPAGIRDRAGRLLLGSDQAAVERAVGAPVVVVRRQWLHRLLAERLPSGVVHTGAEVTDVRTLDADLVIAADGVHSAARTVLFPTHPGVEGIGEHAARAVIPTELADPAAELAGRAAELAGPTGELAHTTAELADSTAVSAEPAAVSADSAGGLVASLPAGELLDRRTGRRFGIAPMANGAVYWYASWPGREQGALAAMFGTEAGWHPAVPELIARTGPDSVRIDELVRLVTPLPSLVAGRVALLGDAAHAMTPDLGQGGCLAFEDAVTLGRVLTGVEADGVPAALRRYDAERRPRTTAMWHASNRMNRTLTLTGPAGRARDLALRAVPARVATAIFVKQLREDGGGALRSARRILRREVADDRGSRV